MVFALLLSQFAKAKLTAGAGTEKRNLLSGAGFKEALEHGDFVTYGF